ncbi:MAG: hypothetical protein ABMA64_23100 [Myxococcota bacterium]
MSSDPAVEPRPSSREAFELHLPRNAFGPREIARAGDVWRLFQDAAVIGSSRRGWPPTRYRDEACAFIVRSMVVVHRGPTAFGDRLAVSTWVSSFKREMMSDRQIRVEGPSGPVAAATQRWVHVALPNLKPSRAAPSLVRAFGVVQPEGEADVTLPEHVAVAEAEEHGFTFRAWHTWMDPLAHGNHPAYVDWADEALANHAVARGVDPQGLVPVAEEMTWRSGVVAPEEVTLRGRPVGRAGDAVVFTYRTTGADGRVCAEGTTVRRHRDLDLADHLLGPANG